MYLENLTGGNKFYEIVRRKTIVYILYGKINNTNLPKGTFLKNEFNNVIDAKQFYDKKIKEKLNKNYEIVKTTTTYDMTWSIKNVKPKKKETKTPKTPKTPKTSKTPFPKISLKKGELGKYGYKDIKTLSVKKRHMALDKAIKEYGAQKILKKLGLIKTFQKNKNPKVSNLLMDNMKWSRKKFNSDFKSSWKNSALFKS
jgi:predicted DNA-binding WGR domain protein